MREIVQSEPVTSFVVSYLEKLILVLDSAIRTYPSESLRTLAMCDSRPNVLNIYLEWGYLDMELFFRYGIFYMFRATCNKGTYDINSPPDEKYFDQAFSHIDCSRDCFNNE